MAETRALALADAVFADPFAKVRNGSGSADDFFERGARPLGGGGSKFSFELPGVLGRKLK